MVKMKGTPLLISLLILLTTVSLCLLFLDPLLRHDSATPINIDRKAALLADAWFRLYGLDRPLPPKHGMVNLSLLAKVPAPPHLQNCVAITEARGQIEKFVGDKKYPDWATDGGSGANPPWVEGGDDQNLLFTRVAQRDIWVNQHPLDCGSPKVRFVTMEWPPAAYYGLGSQLLHVAAALGGAFILNRTFVPYPGSFGLAESSNCKGSSYASLDCYYFPLASEDCMAEVQRLLDSGDYKELSDYRNVLSSEERLVKVNIGFVFTLNDYGGNAMSKIWPKFHVPKSGSAAIAISSTFEPWLHSNSVLTILGNDYDFTVYFRYLDWYYTQAVRYMLRWPSARLCHLLNIVKHELFGKQIAMQLTRARTKLNSIQNFDSKRSYLLKSVVKKKRISLQELRSHKIPFEYPILNIHVRQGDKGHEMKLFSFKSHMAIADRLRVQVPNLKHIWLSTEMETVINESKNYSSWTFYYTKMKRISGKVFLLHNVTEVEKSSIIDMSFVNLIFASECDYFVGVLGSNWNRLINSMRMTSGKIGSTYLSLNDWRPL